MTEQKIVARLDGWNKQLIDTSRRNRLLYFNPSTAARTPHGVQLAEPSCDAIWNQLVRLGNKQKFPGLESEIAALDDEESDEDAPPVATVFALRRNEVRAEPGGARLGRVLASMRNRARTSFEEQGIVTLFVTFGLLRWNEDAAGAASGDSYAPLLLVPCELTRSSAREPFELKRHEEEVALNPAIAHKLQTDFKIELPAPPALDTASLEEYWNEIDAAIQKSETARARNWGVLDSVFVGLFSFHKIAMFRDLQLNRELVLRHPVVRALGGDTDVSLAPDEDIPTGAMLDLLPPEEMELVAEADSSQHEAIVAARRGASFVLQGPPGTGKSQTITNIIAECLECDKRVLFVSEKMAALEVVHARLKSAGLGDFCLEAHSSKANKRLVVAEIDRTLRLARLAPPAIHADDDDLERLRRDANTYVRELHAPRLPADVSVHAALGFIAAANAETAGAPDVVFNFDGAGLAPARRVQIESCLDELVRLDAVRLTAESHVWRGATVESGLQARETLQRNLRECGAALGRLETAWPRALAAFGLARFGCLNGLDRVLDLASLLQEGRALPLGLAADWLGQGELAVLGDAAREHQGRAREAKTRRDVFAASWSDAAFALDADYLRGALASDDALERAGGEDAARQNRVALETHFKVAPLLGDIERTGGALAASLGIDAPVSLADAVKTSKLAHLAQKRARPLASWFAPGAFAELEAQREACRRDLQSRQNLETNLAARRNLDPFLALPCGELADKFATQYGFFARFGAAFKADRARVLAASISPDWNAESAIADLRSAQTLLEARAAAQGESVARANRFGAWWNGDATNLNDLADAISTSRAIAELWGEVPDELVRVLAQNGTALDLADEQCRELDAALSALQEHWKPLSDVFSVGDTPFKTPLSHAPLAVARDWLGRAGASLLTFFAACDSIDRCQVNGAAVSVAARLQMLDDAEHIARDERALEMASDNLRQSFGPLFEGRDTSWDAILFSLDWTQRVADWFGGNAASPEFRTMLADAARRDAALQHAAVLAQTRDALRPFLNGLHAAFSSMQVGGARPLEQASFADARAWCEEKLARWDELEDWLAWERLSKRAEELGLQRASADGFLDGVRSNSTVLVGQIKPLFWRRAWMLWVDFQTASVPALHQFAGASHSANLDRFARLDAESQTRARDRLRALLSGRKPVLGLARAGQMAVLQREAVKRTRHIPLRQLFEQTADVVQKLKPCMLMSPLSVAQFLPPGKIRFDVVIFDEASQICPEDAIGAIARGSQVIVVGDNKQMPPSRFFSASEDDTEDENAGTIESILDECVAAGIGQRSLRWHYRSKFEELISFSNRHFYDDNLMTFPGPAIAGEDGARRALLWERVEGFYTSGGARSNRLDANTNRIEAQRVAEMAADHFRIRPKESLGIITFNEAQRGAVWLEILRIVAREPNLEPHFDTAREDGFFIKALENVQGDERDHILFSVGFGPQQNPDGTAGKMSLALGPLIRAGGERRLNVAITRARLGVRIVTSFDPHALERSTSRGAQLLKSYLEWAKAGALGRANGAQNNDDSVARAVARVLSEAGWATHERVGLGEFRVDVAVEDPDVAGALLFGVLCDGRNYAAAATAHDRDCLRPTVLDRLGWRLHRVWSPDWIANPARETQKLLAAVNQARESARAARAQAAMWVAGDDDDAQMVPGQTLVPSNVGATTQIPKNDDDLLPITTGAFYDAVVLRRRGDAEDFNRLASGRADAICDALLEVVDGEGPISANEATRRVVAAWDMNRAGARLLATIETLATQAARRQVLQIREEKSGGQTVRWYWPMNLEHPEPRQTRPGDSTRARSEIALEEIVEAAIRVLRDSVGCTRDELITGTARFLGWKQVGTNVRERIEKALELLDNDARVRSENGDYVLI